MVTWRPLFSWLQEVWGNADQSSHRRGLSRLSLGSSLPSLCVMIMMIIDEWLGLVGWFSSLRSCDIFLFLFFLVFFICLLFFSYIYIFYFLLFILSSSVGEEETRFMLVIYFWSLRSLKSNNKELSFYLIREDSLDSSCALSYFAKWIQCFSADSYH